MARIAKSIPFAATLLRQRSTWLIQQLALLKRHIGENSIHDTRVQSRRMRAALEAFQDLIPASEWQQFYDSVREITRALGEIRETEVMCSLIEGLATPEDLGEQVALEFLEEKLQRKMRKLRKRLDRELSRTDLRLLRSRMHRLISRVAPSGETDLERAQRVLRNQAEPILTYRVRGYFDRASDKRLHKLRIAAKKLRYSMEVFDPCWPGGLETQIAVTRALQDAGGYHQDWTVLKRFLEREIERLEAHHRSHLTSQISRLLAGAGERKSELRAQILPAVRELQNCLHGLFEPAELIQ
jgi:CHAD domain-containing protein